MAIQNFGICDPGPGVSISLDYDDVTLLVQDVNFQNLSNNNARITLTIMGVANNVILARQTPRTTQSISNLNIHMVATTPPKGSPSVGLPANIQVSCAWPA